MLAKLTSREKNHFSRIIYNHGRGNREAELKLSFESTNSP